MVDLLLFFIGGAITGAAIVFTHYELQKKAVANCADYYELKAEQEKKKYNELENKNNALSLQVRLYREEIAREKAFNEGRKFPMSDAEIFAETFKGRKAKFCLYEKKNEEGGEKE